MKRFSITAMDRRIIYVVIALMAALLFFIAIGYDGWGCGGSIFSESCKKLSRHETTGALLLVSGMVVLAGAILMILVIVLNKSWANIAATVVTAVAAILAIAGVFFYYDVAGMWSPYISTIAMTLTISLAFVLIFELATTRVR